MLGGEERCVMRMCEHSCVCDFILVLTSPYCVSPTRAAQSSAKGGMSALGVHF